MNKKDITPIDEIWDEVLGPVGSKERNEAEAEAEVFCLAERLKEERLRAGMTQQQLAERIGADKGYISRIENGKADVQFSTLFKLFQGLGRRVAVSIL